MKLKPVTRFTADSKEIIVREATEEDALALIELKKSYIKDTRSIPLYEFEYRNDIAMEKDLIKRFRNEENSLLLVAEHGNQLIGNIDLSGNQRKKLFHTGMIGMGIAHEWQNRKIGRFLIETLMSWAQESSPLKIIWLEVYSTNTGGRKLYSNLGFRECGIIENFFGDDSPADKITMVKYL
ncbi:GNAT family N-acetyltransferase [Flavobacterium sp. MFBS3-15]|uniref:GNAT family N-acetyltransferase n=1 Tax=Flavobacterium sp. MFBS3-15 TaxID=2989816 RepID=UPI002235D00B|nr:GNAT family N-acetyltransferase [Flavobacterium sp. MFBS3-15]MCW4467737.1 GNAT family N-acetyltransferase [Flavobacterium sp. MFBS3-15]